MWRYLENSYFCLVFITLINKVSHRISKACVLIYIAKSQAIATVIIQQITQGKKKCILETYFVFSFWNLNNFQLKDIF